MIRWAQPTLRSQPSLMPRRLASARGLGCMKRAETHFGCCALPIITEEPS